MKCSKGGYLGVERVDRCRNCQYDFSLSSTIPEPDFTIRREPDGVVQPLEDLSLVDAASEWSRRRPLSDVGQDLDRLFGEPEREADRALNALVPMPLAAVAEPTPPPAPPALSRRGGPGGGGGRTGAGGRRRGPGQGPPGPSRGKTSRCPPRRFQTTSR